MANKKKSHYETIGVAPSASPEEIKRVFRKKADRAHPDKGGNHLEMSELNHAYEVLIDPRRRLLYDRTGDDAPKPTEDQVRNLVLQAFTDALNKDAPNILDHAKKCLDHARADLSNKIVEAKRSRDKLKAKRDKISRKKDGLNAFHMIIDQQLPMLDHEVAKFEDGLKVCDLAIKELKQYKSAEEIPAQQPMVVYYGAGYTGATTTAY